jgi:hypothetical protein
MIPGGKGHYVVPFERGKVMNDQDGPKPAFRARVQEMKDGIEAMLEAHALPGSGGVITVALLELGIERHLRISATENAARELFDGVLKNVLEGRNTGGA